MFLSVTGFELDLSQLRSDGVSPSREPRCVRARVVFSLGCCCVGNGGTSFSLPHLFPTPALLKLQTHLACFPPLSCHRWQTQRSALLYCQAFFFFFFSTVVFKLFVQAFGFRSCTQVSPLPPHPTSSSSSFSFPLFSYSLSPSTALPWIPFSSLSKPRESLPLLMKHCVGFLFDAHQGVKGENRVARARVRGSAENPRKRGW